MESYKLTRASRLVYYGFIYIGFILAGAFALLSYLYAVIFLIFIIIILGFVVMMFYRRSSFSCILNEASIQIEGKNYPLEAHRFIFDGQGIFIFSRGASMLWLGEDRYLCGVGRNYRKLAVRLKSVSYDILAPITVPVLPQPKVTLGLIGYPLMAGLYTFVVIAFISFYLNIRVDDTAGSSTEILRISYCALAGLLAVIFTAVFRFIRKGRCKEIQEIHAEDEYFVAGGAVFMWSFVQKASLTCGDKAQRYLTIFTEGKTERFRFQKTYEMDFMSLEEWFYAKLGQRFTPEF